MSDSLTDRQQQYQTTQAYFERLGRFKGLDLEQLKDPEFRINLIKLTSAEQFLELMSVANAKLRGEYKKWSRDYHEGDHRSIVTSALLVSPNLEPPSNSKQEFTDFFDQMRQALTQQNLGMWSTKLYTAIIFLHMFPDGNGRLARNAFNFLLTGEMAQENYSIVRPSLIKEFCETVNILAIKRMLKQNGLNRFKYEKLGSLQNTTFYQAEERSGFDENNKYGLVARLKFIAAKKAGIVKSRALNDDEDSVSQIFGSGKVIGFEINPNAESYGQEYMISTSKWTPDEQKHFREEYEKVKTKWFALSLDEVEANADLAQLWLEIGLNFPNPYFVKFFLLLRVVAAGINKVSWLAILNSDPYIAKLSEKEKHKYLNEIQEFLVKRPDLIQTAKELVI